MTQVDVLGQRLKLLQARQNALEDNRKWLRALGEESKSFAKGLSAGEMKPEDCAQFFAFASNQALQNAEASLDLEVQMKQLQEEIARTKRELAQKQGRRQTDRLAAVVSVEMPEEGEFTLELSYLVMQASWQPQYDVRVKLANDGRSGEVELTYLAQVRQQTSEDWSQVNLSLSTARPSQVASLPELEPKYLDVFAPFPQAAYAGAAQPQAMFARRSVARSSDGGALMSELDEPAFPVAAAPAGPPPAEIAVANVEQTGTSYVFRIARAVDIPSDNSPHKTTIAYDTLPCKCDYVSAPASEANAHLRATVTNTSERVLLEGQSSIFLGSDYVGTTQVKMTAPREEFKIFLGIDDSIKVKREQTERAVEKGALLQSDLRRITYSYRITIKNYAAFERDIELIDHLPVAKHERIKVKVLNMQPQPGERTKSEIAKWRFMLKPDAEYKVEYRYSVEHPHDLTVTGLS
jgi:uncharacterized protein (TIGR02231 family)